MRGEEEQAFQAKGASWAQALRWEGPPCRASWAQALRWKGYPPCRAGRSWEDGAGPRQTNLDFAGHGFYPRCVGASRTWSKGVTFKLCVEKVLMSLENVNVRERRQSPQNIRPDLCAVSRLHYVKKPGKPRKTETRFIWPTGGGGVVKWAVSTLGVQGLFWGGE